MKLLTIAVPTAEKEEELNTTLESLCGNDSRVEILVTYDPVNRACADLVLEYQRRFPDNVKAIRQSISGRDAVITAGIEEASGRSIKIVEAGDTVSEESMERVLENLERCDADVFISGYQTVNPKSGAPMVLIPELNCSGRQIDIIKLSEKFREMQEFLCFPCLCFSVSFLKEIRTRLSLAGISGDLAFTILPFIYAQSIMIIPEVFYAQKMEPSFAKETPEAVQAIVTYYESCKPLGKARTSFMDQLISREILNSFSVLLKQETDRKKLSENAQMYWEWLQVTSPFLAKTNSRQIRHLCLAEKYRRLFRCKNNSVVVESCHV